MKNQTQIIVFLLIIAGGFWVGTQWGRSDKDNLLPVPEAPQKITISRVGENTSTITPVTTPTTSTTTPAATTPAATPTTTPETVTPDATKPTTTPTTTPTTPGELPTKTSDKVNHYVSTYAGYEFDIPANMYYSAFGGGNGVMHTVGLGTEDVPETLEGSSVRVYFYGKKVVPELKGTSKVVDPNGKYVYILLNGAYSVRVEANDINHPVVKKILETIKITQ